MRNHFLESYGLYIFLLVENLCDNIKAFIRKSSLEAFRRNEAVWLVICQQ